MLPEIRLRIRRETIANITRYRRSRRSEIEERLAELRREREIKHTMAAGATALAVLGLALALFGRPRWLLLPVAVCGVAVHLRHAGFRTRKEIEVERRVLANRLSPSSGNPG